MLRKVTIKEEREISHVTLKAENSSVSQASASGSPICAEKTHAIRISLTRRALFDSAICVKYLWSIKNPTPPDIPPCP